MKKTMKQMLTALLAVAMIASMLVVPGVAANDEGGAAGVNYYNVTLDTNVVSVYATEADTVTVTAEDGAVYAVSADATVATATVAGNKVTVTGVAEGETAVYVVAADAAVTTVAEFEAAGDKLAVITVTVKAKEEEPTEAIVATKGTYTMEAGALFADTSWRSETPKGASGSDANRYEITQDATKVVDKVFTVYAKTDASGTTAGYMEADAKTYDDGYVTTHNISFGDKIKFMGDDLTPNAVIGFTTDAPATLKVWWRGGGTGGRTVAIATPDATATGEHATYKTVQANVLMTGTPCDDANVLHVDTFELTKAGTYYLGNVINSNRIYKLELVVAEAPAVDKTDLEAAITAAEAAVPADIYTVSDDTEAADVANGTKFMTESDKAAYDTALDAAKALLEKADAIQAEVDAAAEALTTAAGKVQTGTKTESVDKTALDAAIAAAKELASAYTVRPDTTVAANVKAGSKYILRSDKDALDAAIADAEAVAANAAATQEEVDAAVAALNEAVAAVEVQTGTKTGSNTSSSSIRDDGRGEPTTPAVVGNFADVPADSWYADSVKYCMDKNLVNGTSDTTFEPTMTTTRGMVMTVLARLAGVDTTGGETWYTKGMEWAVEQGISDGTNPEVVITREQLAVMLYRYANAEAVEATMDFVDADQTSDWAVEGMTWAVAKGIVLGKGEKVLDPLGACSRAEMVTMLARFCKL